MSGGTERSAVARIIRAIPPDQESSVPVDGLPEPAAAGAVVTLLSAFGALAITTDPATGALRVRAATTTAALFLKSLAEYVEQNSAVLHNWSRIGTSEPPYDEQEILSGPQFLYFMERRRMSAFSDAAPLRSVRVSQVVVKRVGQLSGPEYLVMHDPAARQFQLPGGHARDGDQDASDVAVRELQEELPGFVFDSSIDQLIGLGIIDITAVSRSYGVSTRYQISFFHLQSGRRSLLAGPGGRWLAERDLLDADARVEGMTLNLAGLRKLDQTVAGGIACLPASLPRTTRSALPELARRKPLEFWSFVVGVVGIVLTVVIYFIQD
ncbi:NUDIX domain-containing protein [Micromonospora sp. NPDC049497]|uniref:NUDIX domain-containing protein n=1 Tax=Micromonospora sp. NPDC049497 TaxID=3364273 RepID=UPI0037AA2B9E